MTSKPQRMKIALVTVAYNRPDSLHRLLRSLEAADYGGDDITLIISVDKSQTDEVERLALDYRWPHGPKKVKLHERNMGLRAHILSQGVEEFDEFEALVILEDDVIVSPAFYSYVCQTVATYADNPDIAGISLYSFPLNTLTQAPFEPLHTGYDAFFMRIAQSWGQVWMRESWRRFYDWYKANEDFAPDSDVPAPLFTWTRSWLKYHTRYCLETSRYFVYPYVAFSSNCGEGGTHADNIYSNYQTSMQMALQGPLRLPSTPKEGVRYDAFFENEALHDALGLDDAECCLDLNGFRGASPKRRYVLSSLPLPYATVKSWGLRRHPVEVNVLASEQGGMLHLYDTSRPAPAPAAAGTPGDILYAFRLQSMVTFVRHYGVRRLVSDSIHKILARLRRKR